MIPQTYPSSFAYNGQQQMLVYFLPSIVGLQKWTDYIPIKLVENGVENSYDNNGYINVSSVEKTNESVPFKDYVPVYVDSSATDAWQANNVGYIPYGYAGASGASLVLDFTNNSTLDSRITFTRASNATFVGSNGLLQTAVVDAPRFDYDPITLVAQGLLTEEQRSNLLVYSEDFNSGGVWNKALVTVTTDTTASPSGLVDASTLTGSATSGEHRLFQNITTSSAISISIFAKKNTQDFLQIRTQNILSGFVNFDLNLGLATATTATGQIENYGNGWYRCTANFPAILITNISFNLVTSLTASRGEFNALATSLYIHGSQLETGTFPTSYIPTLASQATRAADVAIMTGTNFSSWYNQTEGSFYVSCAVVRPSSSSVLGVDDGTSSNRAQMGNTGTGAGQFVGVASTAQWSITSLAGSFPLNTLGKMAMAYKVNDIAATSNAGAVGTDVLATIPTVSQLTIGTANSSFYGSGHIRQIAYYPRRLTNIELQGITS